MSVWMRTANRLTCVLFPIGVCCVMAAQAPEMNPANRDHIIVGVLEDINGSWMGKSEYRAVRLAFEKDGAGWRPFLMPHIQTKLESLTQVYPNGMRFAIAFDGRSLGTVTTKPPNTFGFFGEVETGNIGATERIPIVGKKSMDYAGFPSEPVYRPLIAVSKPYFSDPDKWRRSTPLAQQSVVGRKLFRDRFSKVENCRNPTENVPRLLHYRDEDIVVSRAYSSKNGSLLIELNLTGYACDGPVEDGGPFFGQWYLISPSGTAKFIGANMWLVDAGDYDNDGKSEVVFAINAYNTGGYRLFYNNFEKSAEFIFHYH